LFVGVDDNGKLLGISDEIKELNKKNVDGYILRFTNIIKKYLGRAYVHYMEVKIINLDDNEICVVSVLPVSEPVYLKNKSKEEFYVRTSASSEQLNMSEVKTYLENKRIKGN
jgi:hypothetical protein